MKKYAYLNPNDGQYTTFDTKEAVIAAAVHAAFEFFITHTHGKPFAEIEVDEATGAETWSAAHDGSPMLSPAQLLAEVEAMQQRMQQFLIPVSIPGESA